MRSILHPKQYLQFKLYLNATCTDAENVDNSFLEHLLTLHRELLHDARLLLLAFDYSYDENGQRQKSLSAFHTPKLHAASIASQHPRQFEWIASIHPYREDSVEAVFDAAKNNARAIKWLPPGNRRGPFFPSMRSHRMPP